jgi:hypothetical protein
MKFEIPASCSPTFKTWNISNQWHLRVTAFFKCLGKVTTKPYNGGITLISEPKLSGNVIVPGVTSNKKGELPGDKEVSELPGNKGLSELPGDKIVAELPGDRIVAELPGEMPELPG